MQIQKAKELRDKLQEDIHIKEQDIQELENNLKIAQDKVKVLEKEYADRFFSISCVFMQNVWIK